jgi:hypothetical protein
MSSQALVRKQTTEVDPLIVHIRAQALHWTEQLSVADTRQDLEGVVFRLLNDVRFFKELIDQVDQDVPALSADFAKEIHRFMATNLHQGLTLKRLAKFLGYSILARVVDGKEIKVTLQEEVILSCRPSIISTGRDEKSRA